MQELFLHAIFRSYQPFLIPRTIGHLGHSLWPTTVLPIMESLISTIVFVSITKVQFTISTLLLFQCSRAMLVRICLYLFFVFWMFCVLNIVQHLLEVVH